MLVPVFTNVNEEGMVYDKWRELAPALELLEEFPNDCIIITLEHEEEIDLESRDQSWITQL